jgi:lysophospholipase
LKNGLPTRDRCTYGFDHFGYVVGISSSVFNQALYDLDKASESKLLSNVIRYVTDKKIDGALVPNPFYKLDHVDTLTSDVAFVSLVDGGEDGQNIPIYPFLQPSRKVDVIFATDSTVSFYEGGWPNGSSIIATANYAASTGVAFPPTPLTPEEFVEQKLVDRTVFFGCRKAPPSAPYGQWPLLVYIPNRYHSYPSNSSTFRRTYPSEDSIPFMGNGYDLLANYEAQLPKPASQSEWSACVACALISRGLDQGEKMTAQCSKCMKDYCWDEHRGLSEKNEKHPKALDALERQKKVSLMKQKGGEHDVEVPVEDGEEDDGFFWTYRYFLIGSGIVVVGLVFAFVVTRMALARARKNAASGPVLVSGSTEDERRPLVAGNNANV